MGIGAHQILDKAFEANEALTQYRLVKLVTANDRDVDLCDTAGEAALGVVQEEVSAQDATDSRFVDIRLMGVSVVEAGGVLTKGTLVQTDGVGKLQAVPVAVGNEEVAGILLDDAAADGDWVAVLLTPGMTTNTSVS